MIVLLLVADCVTDYNFNCFVDNTSAEGFSDTDLTDSLSQTEEKLQVIALILVVNWYLGRLKYTPSAYIPNEGKSNPILRKLHGNNN